MARSDCAIDFLNVDSQASSDGLWFYTFQMSQCKHLRVLLCQLPGFLQSNPGRTNRGDVLGSQEQFARGCLISRNGERGIRRFDRNVALIAPAFGGPSAPRLLVVQFSRDFLKPRQASGRLGRSTF